MFCQGAHKPNMFGICHHLKIADLRLRVKEKHGCYIGADVVFKADSFMETLRISSWH